MSKTLRECGQHQTWLSELNTADKMTATQYCCSPLLSIFSSSSPIIYPLILPVSRPLSSPQECIGSYVRTLVHTHIWVRESFSLQWLQLLQWIKSSQLPHLCLECTDSTLPGSRETGIWRRCHTTISRASPRERKRERFVVRLHFFLSPGMGSLGWCCTLFRVPEDCPSRLKSSAEAFLLEAEREQVDLSLSDFSSTTGTVSTSPEDKTKQDIY